MGKHNAQGENRGYGAFLVGGTSHNIYYLDFSPFSRSLYVLDIYTSKQQRLNFPRKIVASLSAECFR